MRASAERAYGARPRLVLRPVGARHRADGLRSSTVGGGPDRRLAISRPLRTVRPPRRAEAPDARGRAHGVGLDDRARRIRSLRRRPCTSDHDGAAAARRARPVSRDLGLGPAQQHSRATFLGSHARAADHVQLAVPRIRRIARTRSSRSRRRVVQRPAGWRDRHSRQDELFVDGGLHDGGIAFATRIPRDAAAAWAEHRHAAAALGCEAKICISRARIAPLHGVRRRT